MPESLPLPSCQILLDQVAKERETMNVHADSLDTRAGFILGFAGVLVGLGATAGPKVAADTVFQSGLAVVIIAAALAAWAVLPRPYPVLQVLPARQKLLAAPASETQLQLLDIQIKMVMDAADQIRLKGARVRWSIVCLSAAVFLVVVGTLVAGG